MIFIKMLGSLLPVFYTGTGFVTADGSKVIKYVSEFYQQKC